MDLALKARRTIVLMTHVNKDGEPKIKASCTLPLTAERCVDLIITDRAVIEVTPDGLLLREVSRNSSVPEVIASTGAPLALSREIGILEERI